MSSIRANRQRWNVTSRAYQEEHDPQIGAAPRLWGMFSLPDARLRAIAEEHGAASYQLTYGDWIKTLRGAGLIIDDLIEPRPEPGMRSGYTGTDPPDWARHWPAEMLWITHKP